MYVCMYVCMYVRLYVCMYVCMYVFSLTAVVLRSKSKDSLKPPFHAMVLEWLWDALHPLASPGPISSPGPGASVRSMVADVGPGFVV